MHVHWLIWSLKNCRALHISALYCGPAHYYVMRTLAAMSHVGFVCHTVSEIVTLQSLTCCCWCCCPVSCMMSIWWNRGLCKTLLSRLSFSSVGISPLSFSLFCRRSTASKARCVSLHTDTHTVNINKYYDRLMVFHTVTSAHTHHFQFFVDLTTAHSLASTIKHM